MIGQEWNHRNGGNNDTRLSPSDKLSRTAHTNLPRYSSPRTSKYWREYQTQPLGPSCRVFSPRLHANRSVLRSDSDTQLKRVTSTCRTQPPSSSGVWFWLRLCSAGSVSRPNSIRYAKDTKYLSLVSLFSCGSVKSIAATFGSCLVGK